MGTESDTDIPFCSFGPKYRQECLYHLQPGPEVSLGGIESDTDIPVCSAA